jgi:hypothetical protein
VSSFASNIDAARRFIASDWFLCRIMENDASRVTMAGAKTIYSVAQIDAIHTARTFATLTLLFLL